MDPSTYTPPTDLVPVASKFPRRLPLAQARDTNYVCGLCFKPESQRQGDKRPSDTLFLDCDASLPRSYRYQFIPQIPMVTPFIAASVASAATYSNSLRRRFSKEALDRFAKGDCVLVHANCASGFKAWCRAASGNPLLFKDVGGRRPEGELVGNAVNVAKHELKPSSVRKGISLRLTAKTEGDGSTATRSKANKRSPRPRPRRTRTHTHTRTAAKRSRSRRVIDDDDSDNDEGDYAAASVPAVTTVATPAATTPATTATATTATTPATPVRRSRRRRRLAAKGSSIYCTVDSDVEQDPEAGLTSTDVTTHPPVVVVKTEPIVPSFPPMPLEASKTVLLDLISNPSTLPIARSTSILTLTNSASINKMDRTLTMKLESVAPKVLEWSDTEVGVFNTMMKAGTLPPPPPPPPHAIVKSEPVTPRLKAAPSLVVEVEWLNSMVEEPVFRTPDVATATTLLF